MINISHLIWKINRWLNTGAWCDFVSLGIMYWSHNHLLKFKTIFKVTAEELCRLKFQRCCVLKEQVPGYCAGCEWSRFIWRLWVVKKPLIRLLPCRYIWRLFCRWQCYMIYHLETKSIAQLMRNVWCWICSW